MTAREFVREYVENLGVPENDMLHFLDGYLTGITTVRYAQFPDAELPEGFFEDADEPADFEVVLEEFIEASFGEE